MSSTGQSSPSSSAAGNPAPSSPSRNSAASCSGSSPEANGGLGCWITCRRWTKRRWTPPRGGVRMDLSKRRASCPLFYEVGLRIGYDGRDGERERVYFEAVSCICREATDEGKGFKC
ncbi:unnamed protein product [Musa acuminata subsp. burmannicoides]